MRLSTEPAVREVRHDGGTLHVVDHPGDEPGVLLLHGFPDDHRAYDRLVPELGSHRVVTFDWLGYGRSGRPVSRGYSRTDRQRDLTSVIETLELDAVVVVAHDASGPEAVEWTLEHPDRVTRLVLLNTYYGNDEALRLPEMIRLLADPGLSPLADAMLDDPQHRLWLLAHTARQFGLDPSDTAGIAARAVLPQFFGENGRSDALAEIRAWTRDLPEALTAQDQRVGTGDLAALEPAVRVVFGADDAYLNPELARNLARRFTKAEVHLIDDAGHWPQWDQPEAVAAVINGTWGQRASANVRSS